MGLCPGEGSLSRGSMFRGGVSVQGRGLCPGEGSLSMGSLSGRSLSKEISVKVLVSLLVVSVQGGLCSGRSVHGVSLLGFLSRRVSIRVSLSRAVSLRVSVLGISVQGVSVGLLSRRVSIRGTLSRGLCPGVSGGLCPGGSLSLAYCQGSLSKGSLSGGLCPRSLSRGLCPWVSVQGGLLMGSLSSRVSI